MMKSTRTGRLLAGCAVAGVAVVTGLSAAVAVADPAVPSPPAPGHPAVPVAPPATPQAIGTGPAAGPAMVPAPGAGAAQALPPQPVPASSGTLRDYFAAQEVQLQPEQPADFTALNITLPMPPGWTRVPDPNVPDAFVVIADRHSGALYAPNAQVVVYRLIGHFDAAEAMTHGFVDSQQLPAWRTTNASLADFGGFPSSLIEGTYRQDDLTLNTSQRHVIATSAAHSYLVSLTVTTGLGEAVAKAPATDAVVNGFRVVVPGSTPAPSPTPAAPGTAPPATLSAPSGAGAATAPHR